MSAHREISPPPLSFSFFLLPFSISLIFSFACIKAKAKFSFTLFSFIILSFYRYLSIFGDHNVLTQWKCVGRQNVLSRGFTRLFRASPSSSFKSSPHTHSQLRLFSIRLTTLNIYREIRRFVHVLNIVHSTILWLLILSNRRITLINFFKSTQS